MGPTTLHHSPRLTPHTFPFPKIPNPKSQIPNPPSPWQPGNLPDPMSPTPMNSATYTRFEDCHPTLPTGNLWQPSNHSLARTSSHAARHSQGQLEKCSKVGHVATFPPSTTKTPHFQPSIATLQRKPEYANHCANQWANHYANTVPASGCPMHPGSSCSFLSP